MTTGGQDLARRRGLEQWAGLGGVVYVVLFVVGSIVAFKSQPDNDSAPATLQRYWADAGHRDKVFIGWVLVVLGLFFFLWFLSSLRQTVRRLDGDGLLTTLTSVGGVVYATLALAAISLNMALKTMSDDTYRKTVYPELIHASDDVGWVLHSAGGIGAGAMMIGASLVALRARVAPGWLGWVGMVAGLLALASIAFLPQLLIAGWLVVVGVMLFLGRPGVAVSP